MGQILNIDTSSQLSSRDTFKGSQRLFEIRARQKMFDFRVRAYNNNPLSIGFYPTSMYFDRIIPLMRINVVWGYKLIGFHYLGYELDICHKQLHDTNTLVGPAHLSILFPSAPISLMDIRGNMQRGGDGKLVSTCPSLKSSTRAPHVQQGEHYLSSERSLAGRQLTRAGRDAYIELFCSAERLWED